MALAAWLVTVVGACAAWAQSQPAGHLLNVQGRVEVERAGLARPAVARQDLFAGDVVRTGPASRAAILLADDSRVKLNANSSLRLKAVTPRPAGGLIPVALRTGKTLLELLVGETWIHTSAPPGGLEIETPAVTAAVRGTELDLTVALDGESRLALLDGLVEYRNPFGVVVLVAGELVTARVGQAPQKQVLVNPQDAVQWSLYYPAIYSARDYPLVTGDRVRLGRLHDEARAEAAAAPGDPTRQARLGEVLHDLGRRDEARAVFAAILAIHPADARALTGLGWIALEEHQADRAIAHFTRVAPAGPTSLLGLALAQYRRGDLAASAAALAESVRRFGPTPAALTEGALIDLVQGEATRARTALDEALRLDPSFGRAYGLRSNVALTQNRKADALSDARRAVAVSPHSPSAHLDLSLALQAAFDLDAALEAARRAVALDPGNARARAQVGRLLLGFDRVDEAAREIEEARRLDPGDPATLALVGFLRLIRGETAAAREAFEAALDAGATSGDPHLGLGLVAFREGRPAEGLRAFQAAVTLEPRVSLFQSYLAKALYQLERRGEGLMALDRARELDPRDPTPDLYAGVFLTDLNRPADAIAAYQRSVALNDHRAVFRSRLLLDRDLATRNVDLSRAFVALGQLDRARALGIRALHDDPRSSSTHLFYASTLTALNAAQQANNEFLLTRLLLPVNQASFNSFRDYTALLEAPRIQGSVEGTYGSFETFESSGLLFGGTTGVAGSTLLSYRDTDGPKRRNSDERTWTSLTLFKWAPTPRQSAFLQLFHTDTTGGDTFANQRGFTANDPDFRRDSRATLVEGGYQIELGPGHTVLLAAQRQFDRIGTRNTDIVVDPLGSAPELFPAVAVQTTTVLELSTREPYYDVQGAYLGRVGAHELWLAADFFRGEPESRQRIRSVSDLLVFGAPAPGFSTTSDDARTSGFTRQFLSLVLQDTWHPLAGLYFTGALRYDWARDGDIFGSVRETSSVASPQFGILWRATAEHTFRAAAFRAFQTHAASRIFPSQIAGFPVQAPVASSSDSTQYQVAWDGELSPTTFATIEIFRRDVDSPTFGVDATGEPVRTTLTRHRTGGAAAINQLLGRYWGVSLGYLRVHRDDPGDAGDNDLVQLGLRFVHPSGVSARGALAYVSQQLGPSRPQGAPRDFVVASLALAYEFPRKWGLLVVGVDNVLDERFELRGDPLGRENATIPELPERRFFVSLRVNF